MKKITFLILSILMCLFVRGQITLTNNNCSLQNTDSTTWWTADTTGVKIPVVGTNTAWDYSGLMVQNATYTTEIYNNAKSRAFPTAIKSVNASSMAFGSMTAIDSLYYSEDNSGIYFLGSHTPEQKFSLSKYSPMLNKSDSLWFLDTNFILTPPQTQIKFPATYGTAWKNGNILKTDLKVTVVELGFAKTLCEIRTIDSVSQQIVGWGNLTIPSGDESFTCPALMLKYTEVAVDSFFQSSQGKFVPISSSTLNLMGMQQGQVTKTYKYSFLRENSIQTAIDVYTTDNSFSKLSSVDFSREVLFTGIQEYQQFNNFVMYPNPTKGIFYVLTDKDAVIEVFNLSGKKLLTFNKVAEQTTINLTGFEDGVYLIKVQTKNGVATRKINLIK